MKRHKVLIHPDAEDELDNAYRHIARDAPERATRWRKQLLKRARLLRTFPQRSPKAPEAKTLGADVRHLIVGDYRVLFVVESDTVTVLHIRHGARLPVGAPLPHEADDD